MHGRLFLAFASLVLVALAAAPTPTRAQQPAKRAVVLISIDGMHPDYVRQADKHGLRIPTLRRMLRDGASATAVTGVLPTVTYPSHTTMLTGVWPVKHGIPTNVPFDPFNRNAGVWYWYAEDIKVPTLWDAASAAGYVTGSVSWPVSVGAPGIRYNIPEYWRAQKSPEEIKLVRAVSTPGLLKELEPHAGRYTNDLDDAIPGDWGRTKYAIAMIQRKQVRFLTIHLAALDHLEHDHGPWSREAFEVLEETDQMVAELGQAMRAADPNAIVAVVSDHGFLATDRELHLTAAFVNDGLIRLTPASASASAAAPAIAEWDAAPWSSSGSAAIVLKDPGNRTVLAKVETLLRTLAADPANGIAEVLDRQKIEALGGGGVSQVAFVVNMREGFSVGTALTGPVVRTKKPGGTHGYAPTRPELHASFIIDGPGIQRGADLGIIDMRAIAPTLASLMDVKLPTADLQALGVSTGSTR
jgi:predicted AlkP superfamily pyrophosphatase or phosphodiesterase